MSPRRQRSIPLGGRYRQVSLYIFLPAQVWETVMNNADTDCPCDGNIMHNLRRHINFANVGK